jgi:hypothetical protein
MAMALATIHPDDTAPVRRKSVISVSSSGHLGQLMWAIIDVSRRLFRRLYGSPSPARRTMRRQLASAGLQQQVVHSMSTETIIIVVVIVLIVLFALGYFGRGRLRR